MSRALRPGRTRSDPSGATGDGLPALVEARLERAFHNPSPVAIDEDFVFRVDCGDGVFAILNRRDRGFEYDILDAGGMGLADGMSCVDLDFDVQAVVYEEDARGTVG